MVLGRHAQRATVVALLFCAALTGCSDDGGGGGDGKSPTKAAPTATAAPTDGAPTDGAAPADRTAAEARIRENWATFFDAKATTAQKADVLENGDELGLLLKAFGGDPNAGQSSARVTGVAFTSATEAAVTYDLMVGKATALPGSKGVSVLQDGTWKVSVKTLCALVEMSGNAAAPGC
ncbi:hypothetical protein [Streptomyces sp. NPDC050504]|uniref:hypothetical protein n=1 Tax=Streptomyces sp. NPDC050504 TaxID=3365618 RepID=UPI003788D806